MNGVDSSDRVSLCGLNFLMGPKGKQKAVCVALRELRSDAKGAR